MKEPIRQKKSKVREHESKLAKGNFIRRPWNTNSPEMKRFRDQVNSSTHACSIDESTLRTLYFD